MQPILFPISAAQEQLGDLGRTSLYELIKRGDIKTVKIGSRTFIARTELEAYVSRISGQNS